MIQGAFWGSGRSDIIIMERDMSFDKKGYTAASYLAVLEENIPRVYEPGLIFMQDNARIHTARVVRAWFEEHAIQTLDWPAYSPDLNPIKHVWPVLKLQITQHRPKIKDIGEGERAYKALQRAIREGQLDY